LEELQFRSLIKRLPGAEKKEEKKEKEEKQIKLL
jgi:hypothetical protein